MILVDTSVWIDHLRATDDGLAALLDENMVLGHAWITGEVALGNLAQRHEVIDLLRKLPQATLATEDEVLTMIERDALHGIGIGYVDVHLLASARLTPDTQLWTRDKRLAEVTMRLGLGFTPAPRPR